MASSSTGRAAPPPPVKKEKWEVKPSSSGPIDLTDEQHSPPKRVRAACSGVDDEDDVFGFQIEQD